jgi:hypothetical protein
MCVIIYKLPVPERCAYTRTAQGSIGTTILHTIYIRVYCDMHTLHICDIPFL